MYLKSLELHGFKSFPNRTVLTFEKGATVIVGPNGSGKSNISDAMRWVLGELSSRNIRGTKMEDVIFGGTDDRRPMGFAEVSVTFDNSSAEHRLDSEYDEVTVTRRYYRTGDSEYLINKQPKRLRDIYELFMNTGVGREGYSIIGQGKIAEIISKKSDERRNIFEEAAGISKYRHRKEESEKKLKATQDNLDRVKDILLELESRVGPLEKEAEKARRGLAIYEQKKRADVSLWLYDSKQIKVDIEKADAAWKLSLHELEIVDNSIKDLEARQNNLYEKAQQNRYLTEQIRNEIQETNDKLNLLQNELQLAENNFRHSKELIRQCEQRIDEISKTKDNANSTRNSHVVNKEGLIASLDKTLTEREEFLSRQRETEIKVNELKRLLEEALDELTVEENHATNLKVRIDVLKSSNVSDRSKEGSVLAEIDKYEKERVELQAQCDKCDESTADFKKDISEKENLIASAKAKISELTEKRNIINDELNAKHVEEQTLIQKADALQRMNDHFEGYSNSIKFVMKEYETGNISGVIHGPLSTLISVDKKYITAIETALGSSLQNIVVEDESTAKSAINALKEANAGRATFYPITAIKSPSELDEIKTAKKFRGYVGRADMLVKTDSQYRSIVEWLLLRTLVFDNIDNASDAAKDMRYRVKIVTLDGQVINAGGSFMGGSAKRDSGILSRSSEIDSMREHAKIISKEIVNYRTEINNLDDEIKQVGFEQANAEQEKELLLALSRTQFAALDTANANLNANESMLNRLKIELEAIRNNSLKNEEELTEASALYDANLERIEALKDTRLKKGEQMGVLDDFCDEMSMKANEAYIRATEIRKDIENVDQLIATVDFRIAELDAEIAAERSRIAEYESQRSGISDLRSHNREESDALNNLLSELQKKRTEANEGADEYDRETNLVIQQIRDKNNSRNAFYEATLRNENEHNRLLEKQDSLGSQLYDEYEITYDEAVALSYPEVNAENREEVAKDQTKFKHELRRLGSYNVGAIEEYASVKIRYDDLSTQYTDLTSSYEELTAIIARLEVEMRSGFLSAFEAINKHFGHTFKELFGGGNAELSLTDPEDVLTSGIEIKAAPPGKIIKSLSLLSGGEQSFVAIALLFAILKVNPTPFCILDEIEAALDEVNVYRFGEYIKRLAEETQFILITHRRGTMEVGNRLYGVTMPQRGISQAIEVNVDEIEGKQKELLG